MTAAPPLSLLAGAPGPVRWDRGWRYRAACRGLEVELFFPAGEKGLAAEEVARAKAICARCPVRAECLSFALATGQRYGVWGGTSEADRAAMARRRRLQVLGGSGAPLGPGRGAGTRAERSGGMR